jgi:serine/threonine protein kinase, bacterial
MAELLNNRYQILQVLGSGGFSETYLAADTHMPSQRRCVIKKMKPATNNWQIYQIAQERFQREATILEELGEKNSQIPKLFAYFAEQGEFFLVQEWIQGQTLTEKVRSDGPLSIQAVERIVTSLLPVLDFVHQQDIIHRDIKPDNILLRDADQTPVLIDFGAVKEAVRTMLNSQGDSTGSIVIGTPGYMPSEQAAGRPVYSSDLYSLGLTAIFLLTGKIPQALDTNPRTGEILWRQQVPQLAASAPTELNLSPQFATVIEKAIQPYPRDRYATAQEMLAALQQSAPLPQQGTPPPVNLPTQVSTQVVSPPPPSFYQPTQQASQPSQPQYQQSHSPQPDPRQVAAAAAGGGLASWVLPAIAGGAAGVAILLGLLLLRPQSSTVVEPSPSPQVASPQPGGSDEPNVNSTPNAQRPVPEPSANPGGGAPSPTAAASPPIEPDITAKPTCGDTGSATETVWYPVFVNNGDLKAIRRQYCQDAIAKTRDDGTPAVQVASFTEQDRAVAFAQEVGGEVGPAQSYGGVVVKPEPAPPAEDGQTAIIIGEPGSKNIRSGPGTSYGVRHIAYPGDVVSITDSAKDKGGFLWYKVYFPKSGAEGWIASQLVKTQ